MDDGKRMSVPHQAFLYPKVSNINGPVTSNHSESKSRSSAPRDLLAKEGNSRALPTAHVIVRHVLSRYRKLIKRPHIYHSVGASQKRKGPIDSRHVAFDHRQFWLLTRANPHGSLTPPPSSITCKMDPIHEEKKKKNS
jgi:hypothetical protein